MQTTESRSNSIEKTHNLNQKSFQNPQKTNPFLKADKKTEQTSKNLTQTQKSSEKNKKDFKNSLLFGLLKQNNESLFKDQNSSFFSQKQKKSEVSKPNSKTLFSELQKSAQKSKKQELSSIFSCCDKKPSQTENENSSNTKSSSHVSLNKSKSSAKKSEKVLPPSIPKICENYESKLNKEEEINSNSENAEIQSESESENTKNSEENQNSRENLEIKKQSQISTPNQSKTENLKTQSPNNLLQKSEENQSIKKNQMTDSKTTENTQFNINQEVEEKVQGIDKQETKIQTPNPLNTPNMFDNKNNPKLTPQNQELKEQSPLSETSDKKSFFNSTLDSKDFEIKSKTFQADLQTPKPKFKPLTTKSKSIRNLSKNYSGNEYQQSNVIKSYRTIKYPYSRNVSPYPQNNNNIIERKIQTRYSQPHTTYQSKLNNTQLSIVQYNNMVNRRIKSRNNTPTHCHRKTRTSHTLQHNQKMLSFPQNNIESNNINVSSVSNTSWYVCKDHFGNILEKVDTSTKYCEDCNIYYNARKVGNRWINRYGHDHQDFKVAVTKYNNHNVVRQNRFKSRQHRKTNYFNQSVSSKNHKFTKNDGDSQSSRYSLPKNQINNIQDKYQSRLNINTRHKSNRRISNRCSKSPVMSKRTISPQNFRVSYNNRNTSMTNILNQSNNNNNKEISDTKISQEKKISQRSIDNKNILNPNTKINSLRITQKTPNYENKEKVNYGWQSNERLSSTIKHSSIKQYNIDSQQIPGVYKSNLEISDFNKIDILSEDPNSNKKNILSNTKIDNLKKGLGLKDISERVSEEKLTNSKNCTDNMQINIAEVDQHLKEFNIDDLENLEVSPDEELLNTKQKQRKRISELEEQNLFLQSEIQKLRYKFKKSGNIKRKNNFSTPEKSENVESQSQKLQVFQTNIDALDFKKAKKKNRSKSKVKVITSNSNKKIFIKAEYNLNFHSAKSCSSKNNLNLSLEHFENSNLKNSVSSSRSREIRSFVEKNFPLMREIFEKDNQTIGKRDFENLLRQNTKNENFFKKYMHFQENDLEGKIWGL